MSDSRDEIDALRKRLEAAEKAIMALKAEDLVIAREIAESFCTLEYNLLLTGVFAARKGEEFESYVKFWSRKVDDAIKEIAASKTVKSAFQIATKFDKKIMDYIKAVKVGTAEEAMDIAHTFIKKYSTVALPLRAVREDDVWLVDIDVGALAVKIANVRVDAKTGDILSYEIPQK